MNDYRSVYVVERHVRYEGSRIIGVFEDAEDARAFALEQAAESRFDRDPDTWANASDTHVFTAQIRELSWVVTEREVQ